MVVLLLVMFAIVIVLVLKLTIQQAKISEQLNGVANDAQKASKAAAEAESHVKSWETVAMPSAMEPTLQEGNNSSIQENPK